MIVGQEKIMQIDEALMKEAKTTGGRYMPGYIFEFNLTKNSE